MATLHGFPILVTGERWCVVDMPDSWAIMDSLDAVPTPVFQYQKDDSGWREAMAQLKRSDTRPPTVPTVVAPMAPPPVRHGRRQFSLARFGILLSSIILGVSPWLPWATIQVSLNGGPSLVHPRRPVQDHEPRVAQQRGRDPGGSGRPLCRPGVGPSLPADCAGVGHTRISVPGPGHPGCHPDPHLCGPRIFPSTRLHRLRDVRRLRGLPPPHHGVGGVPDRAPATLEAVRRSRGGNGGTEPNQPHHGGSDPHRSPAPAARERCRVDGADGCTGSGVDGFGGGRFDHRTTEIVR